MASLVTANACHVLFQRFNRYLPRDVSGYTKESRANATQVITLVALQSLFPLDPYANPAPFALKRFVRWTNEIDNKMYINYNRQMNIRVCENRIQNLMCMNKYS